MIELVFVSVIIIAIIAFMAESAVTQARKGALDRIAYSMTGFLSSRFLFKGGEGITRDDMTHIDTLAKEMLRPEDKNNLGIVAEFVDDKDGARKTQTENKGKCIGPKQSLEGMLSSMRELSPTSSKSGRRVPLYQLTLCLGNMRSSYVMLSRKD